jgi:hypothetical protein
VKIIFKTQNLWKDLKNEGEIRLLDFSFCYEDFPPTGQKKLYLSLGILGFVVLFMFFK